MSALTPFTSPKDCTSPRNPSRVKSADNPSSTKSAFNFSFAGARRSAALKKLAENNCVSCPNASTPPILSTNPVRSSKLVPSTIDRASAADLPSSTVAASTRLVNSTPRRLTVCNAVSPRLARSSTCGSRLCARPSVIFWISSPICSSVNILLFSDNRLIECLKLSMPSVLTPRSCPIWRRLLDVCLVVSLISPNSSLPVLDKSLAKSSSLLLSVHTSPVTASTRA